MKVFIIEDEELYADQLAMVVEQAGHSVCGMATNAEDTLRLFESCQADMALIDINLAGEMDGLELGKWLNRFREDILIIFVTAHYEDVAYFEKASQLSAFGFLKKPIDELQLARTITLAYQHQLKAREPEPQAETDYQTLIIKVKSKYIKIDQKDIVYIVADDKYCAIKLASGDEYLERTSLKELNKKLAPYFFAQTHRSYIVNLNHVQETDVSEFTVKVNGAVVPLGETYKDYFLRRFGA